jgi:prepilin-type N-terminal cleavage/methylation domain-containing protein/prepilin-type processing-associated H-X9-DG protein
MTVGGLRASLKKIPAGIAAGRRDRRNPIAGLFFRQALTKRAGFSLIELLIVVALMVVLYTMWFSFASPVHQRSQKERCQDNLEKLFLSLQIYANDFGKFPLNTNAETSEDVLSALVPRYTSDTSMFICPGGRDPEIPTGVPITKEKISYAYYMGRDKEEAADAFLMSDRQINTEAKNMGDEVFSTNGLSPGNNHSKYGGNFLFGDGSAQTIGPMATFSLAFSNGIVLLNPKP